MHMLLHMIITSHHITSAISHQPSAIEPERTKAVLGCLSWVALVVRRRGLRGSEGKEAKTTLPYQPGTFPCVLSPCWALGLLGCSSSSLSFSCFARARLGRTFSFYPS